MKLYRTKPDWLRSGRADFEAVSGSAIRLHDHGVEARIMCNRYKSGLSPSIAYQLKLPPPLLLFRSPLFNLPAVVRFGGIGMTAALLDRGKSP